LTNIATKRIATARRKTAGSRQTLKAIQKGQARIVFVALDADRWVIDPIIQACQAKGTPLVEVGSMWELGRACGIVVDCASAAITEE
jgi:large subunit ribosomal protein L7A